MFKESKNILLITNANMKKDSGDVALICRRAESFYLCNKIKTRILSQSGENELIIKDYKGLSFSSVNKLSLKRIMQEIKEVNPQVLIYFGVRSYRFIPKVRNELAKIGKEIPVVCDVQGVPEESIEFLSGKEKFLKYLNYFIHKLMLMQGLNHADGAFVVSDKMIEYCNQLILKQHNLEYFKVRCGVNYIFNNRERHEARNRIRHELGVDDDTIVLVFSGFRKVWQKIDYTIEYFKKLDGLSNKVFFCFFCDVDEAFSLKLEHSFPKRNYVLRFLNKDEYFEYLSACDIGVLFRDNNITNKVAFPNKFSDYLNAGLGVVLNSYLYEPNLIMKNYDMPYINADYEVNLSEIESVNNARRENLTQYYERCNQLIFEELTYEKQIERLK